MSESYLEVTYHRGRPLAAYLYLSRLPGDKADHSEPIDDTLVVDRTADGRPIGIEIIDPHGVTLQRINALLLTLDQAELPAAEFAPLQEA